MCLTVTGTYFKQSEFPLAKQQIFSRFPGTSMVCEIIILLSVAVLIVDCINVQYDLQQTFFQVSCTSWSITILCCLLLLHSSFGSVCPSFFQSSGSYDIRQLKRSFWNFEKEHTTTDKLTISYNSYSRNRQQQQKWNAKMTYGWAYIYKDHEENIK